jgi:hypothetical protein
MPNPVRLLETLRRAVDAFRATPGRRGRFVQIPQADSVLVAGDLHGNLTNFKRLLELADLAKHPRRHLVLQELIHGPHRYPDGSDQSHRALDLLAALKCQFPDRVHMLLGNHEMAQWTDRAILKEDEDLNLLFRQGVMTAYGEHGPAIYRMYEELFAVMPLVVRTPNRVLLSHSLPNARRIEDWQPECLFRESWSQEDVQLGGGLHAVAWGRDTSLPTVQAFLHKFDADWLITGHIPCESGYQIPNSRQIILDCRDDQACACLIPAEGELAWTDLLAGIVRLTGGRPAVPPVP